VSRNEHACLPVPGAVTPNNRHRGGGHCSASPLLPFETHDRSAERHRQQWTSGEVDANFLAMHPELFRIPGINLTVPSYGVIVMISFLAATWWTARRCMRVKVDPDIALNLGLISLIASMVGARAFYVIHYWESQFAHDPKQILNLPAGGAELYGGLIGAFIACVLYLLIKRASIRLWADLITPGLLLGMGIGRIGCFAVGCCWGGPCSPQLSWAVRFPFGSPPHQRQWENRLVTAPDRLIFVEPGGRGALLTRTVLKLPRKTLEDVVRQANRNLEQARRGGNPDAIATAEQTHRITQQNISVLLDHFDAHNTSPEELLTLTQDANLRSQPIHPSQIYGAIGPTLLALLTSTYFYRRKRHGTVMPLGLGLYAIQRLIEEAIRADNPHDTFGLTISQSVSIGILLMAIAAYFILRRLPLRSPRAVAFVPPSKDVPKPAATA